MLIVQKFGGSSLADVSRIRRGAQRAIYEAKQGNQVVVVVSAQGDTTDNLVSAAAAIAPNPSAREMDSYLATGEQMSAGLMAMAIAQQGFPAISLTGWQAGIATDGHYGDARVLGLSNDRIRNELSKGKIVVVTGFQGINENNDITTLGRGGSDTTAVALAAYLQADKCQIYTDVDGVYDRDPRIFPDAVRYDEIDYEAMLTLARQGAQVLHDRAVELAKEHGVRIQVLSSFRPGPGTMVTALS
ncbi:MAG: aspartate kinase [Ruminococcaceae bacterium]|nr:aspartate kinase [Oscillospiraceae bacterium]